MYRLQSIQRNVTETFKPFNMYEATTILKKIYMNPVSNVIKVKLHQRKSLKRNVNSCDPSGNRNKQESNNHKTATTYCPPPPNQKVFTSSHNQKHKVIEQFRLVKLPIIQNKSHKDNKSIEMESVLIHRPEQISSSKLKRDKLKTKVLLAHLPYTGTLLPMEYIVSKSSYDFHFQEEKLGPVVNVPKLQENQRRESARLTLLEYGTNTRSKLVFDVFENSSYQSGYGYEKFLNYNNECYRIDSTFTSYSQICAGKGAPLKSYTGKTNCYESSLKPFYRLSSYTDTTLIFESRFESGNLRRAIQVYFRV